MKSTILILILALAGQSAQATTLACEGWLYDNGGGLTVEITEQDNHSMIPKKFPSYTVDVYMDAINFEQEFTGTTLTPFDGTDNLEPIGIKGHKAKLIINETSRCLRCSQPTIEIYANIVWQGKAYNFWKCQWQL